VKNLLTHPRAHSDDVLVVALAEKSNDILEPRTKTDSESAGSKLVLLLCSHAL